MAGKLLNGTMAAFDMRDFLRPVGHASPMPMAELEGANHIIRYANPAFCLLAGKTEAELLGRDFSAVTPVGKECLTLLQRVYRTGLSEIYVGHELPVSHPLFWSYVIWPVLAPDNHTLGIILLVTETTSFHRNAIALNQALMVGSVHQHELTEAAEHSAAQLHAEIIARKHAEEALIRSEKLASVGRMAAVLAHEINNPLATVMGILYLARNTENLPGPVGDYLEKADGELKRIAHITRQTLGFYRESLLLTTFDVGPLFESVLDLLKSKIQSKLAKVERQCDPHLQITAMHGELRQVISNLLLNSLDSLGENGQVTLRASRSTNPTYGSRRIRITVADSGHGIDETILPQIFEAFMTTKGRIGNGLGLWVSKQIIDKHGGSVRVRSATIGARRGTTFSVVLPASD
jgi:two-component system, NtrC family, sensor kinase